MDQEMRMKAFAMRCRGMTWAQIGESLNYDEHTIDKELHAVIEKQDRRLGIRYPRLRVYVQEECGGSIRVFAERMKVSPYRLRQVLLHGVPPSPKLKSKIELETRMTQEEAFCGTYREERDA